MNTTVNWNRNISDYFSKIKRIYDIPIKYGMVKYLQ